MPLRKGRGYQVAENRMEVGQDSLHQVDRMERAQEEAGIGEGEVVQFCWDCWDHRLALLDQENGKVGSRTWRICVKEL